MSTLKELMAQKQEIEIQITEVAKTERREAMAQIKDLMELHHIPVVKLEKEVKKVAAKWKDPTSDKEWSGRGRTPLWFNEATAVPL